MSDKKKYDRIHDVDIDRAALKNIKSLDELKKTEIFNHLDAPRQAEAYDQLWSELKPAAPVVAPAPVSPAPAPAKV